MLNSNKLITYLIIIIIIILSCNNKEKKIIEYYRLNKNQFKTIIENKPIDYNLTINNKIENILIYDSLGMKKSINEILEINENKIFLKFSETECSYCVDQIIEILNNNNFTNIEEDNLVLIGHFLSFSNYYRFIKMNNIKHNIFMIENNKLVLPIDYLNQPYFFLLDSSFIPSNFFIPNKLNSSNTIKYLNDLK